MQSATPSSSSVHGAQSPQRELSILLVEDVAPIRERLAGLLDHPGMMRVCGVATTEREAYQRIGAREYDVLVIDSDLRDGSALLVVHAARQQWVGLPAPLIIMLSHYPLPALRQRCMDAGADHLLDTLAEFQRLQQLIAARFAMTLDDAQVTQGT